jgi:hypothetical protein
MKNIIMGLLVGMILFQLLLIQGYVRINDMLQNRIMLIMEMCQ